MEPSQLQNLIRKYYNGTLAEAEYQQLMLAMETDEEAVKAAIATELAEHEAPPAFQNRNYDELIRKVMMVDAGETGTDHEHTVPVHRIHFLRRSWFRYAAAVLLLMIGLGYWYLSRQSEKQPQVVQTTPAVIAPGKDGAILTLSDGREIVLDSLGNGLVADQQGTKVILKNGQLGYDASAAEIAKYNKMTTPRGRQFHLQLPDGTSVWLNAASSITYPTAFTGNERTVFVTGEVYFDVAKDAARPFLVKVKDQLDVEVLGTSFNINAYPDEEQSGTTLIDGKIKVVVEPVSNTAGRKVLILKPGQQLIVTEEQAIQLKENADLAKVMAWRKGYFNFDDADVPAVMRQLQRWYDIEVVYEGGVPQKIFRGKVGRDLNLSDVLDILKQMELNYRIEGRKLVITQ